MRGDVLHSVILDPITGVVSDTLGYGLGSVDLVRRQDWQENGSTSPKIRYAKIQHRYGVLRR